MLFHQLLISDVVRYILSLILIYGVYTETGIWTVLFACGSTIAIEIQVLLWREANMEKN